MKKTLAIMLALIMVLALVPTVAFAADPVAWIGETGYATLEAAVNAAQSGNTITLGEGEYSLYDVCGHSGAPGYGKGYTAGKDLTFIGKGKETIWQIGSKTPDPKYDGTEYNGDYSFEGAGTVTFKKMTLCAPLKESGEGWNYLGFIRADKTIVEDCTMFGKTFFWGYTSATFTKTTFNCPAGDYAVWTYSSPTMSFYNCTFNSSGKVINVYTDYSAGKHDITVNFKNCTVNNTGESLKPVLNINDRNMVDFKYILNITGDNKVTGVNTDNITCSRLFGFGGKAASNSGRSDVTINGKKVWENGERACAHNGVVFGEGSYNGDVATQYTDGYKDNAFEIIKDDTTGVYVKTCKYCGYTEPFYGELSNEIELTRTVKQGQEVNIETTKPKDTYKVNGSSGITVDYTATMDMTKLKWEKQGSLYDDRFTPWQMLTAQPGWITEDTVVFLKFTFDKNIDLEAFKATYEAAVKAGTSTDVLMLTSDMFEIADGGVTFGPTKDAMTIKCNWNWNKETDPDHAPDPKITLYGFGLPVVKDNWGGNKIDITNSGCVGGMVHIKYENSGPEEAVAMAEPGLNVAANQVPSTYPPEISPTIQIPIVGGCKTDEFTLYYGGGSSGDSGHSYYYPTTTPVPVIVIPPKTGDMTVWQSILHFVGIR